MDIKEILSKVDHTYLNQAAVWDDIKKTLDEGITYSTASACIPPSFVKRAKEYARDRLKICTVTGFPNGYSTALVKCYESSEAVSNGADEIDTVIDIGDLKSQNYDKILKDLKDIKEACQGRILKVIIETCLLTDYEKQKMCEIVSCSGADFIKTSTGFSTGGATREDIILFSKYVAPHVKIKAAGGISTLKDAEDYISLGASRLGTSRIVKLVKKDGEDLKYTIVELLDLGYVTEVPLDIPTPWDGHLIEFKDNATLRGLGVSSIQRVELFNKKAYLVVTMDGLRLQKSHNALVREGYAKEKEAVSVSADMVDEPWDSDVVYASQDIFDKRNIKAIRRYVEDGDQKYIVEFNHKDPMIVTRNNLLILGYLVKKK